MGRRSVRADAGVLVLVAAASGIGWTPSGSSSSASPCSPRLPPRAACLLAGAAHRGEAVQGIGAAMLVPAAIALISAAYPERRAAPPSAPGRHHFYRGGARSGARRLGRHSARFLALELLLQRSGWRCRRCFRRASKVVDTRDDETKVLLTSRRTARLRRLGAIVWAMLEAPSRGGLSALPSVVRLVIGLFGSVGVRHRRRPSHWPMVPLSCSVSHTFTGTNVVTLLLYAALGLASFSCPSTSSGAEVLADSGRGGAPSVRRLLSGLSRWRVSLVLAMGASPPGRRAVVSLQSDSCFSARPSIGGSYWTTYFLHDRVGVGWGSQSHR